MLDRVGRKIGAVVSAESMHPVLLLDVVKFWRKLVETVVPFTLRTSKHGGGTFNLMDCECPHESYYAGFFFEFR
jgi:hypothetical protein